MHVDISISATFLKGAMQVSEDSKQAPIGSYFTELVRSELS